MTGAGVAQYPRWPSEIETSYERIRPLGMGAFGEVFLAKAKSNNNETEATRSGDGDDDSIDSFEKEDDFDAHAVIPSKNNHGPKTFKEHPYVAIKQIQAANEEQIRYASREIEILSEIRHPNVIQCLYSVQLPNSRLVVLTLADGPDLGKLVNTGGALSTSLARLAARHLVAAVSYLHSRGVIHRDIKPDNCLLCLADSSSAEHQSSTIDWLSNEEFWNDKATFDDKKWKVVLADFGFAKALSPHEVGDRASVRNLVQKQISMRGVTPTKEDGDSNGSKDNPSMNPTMKTSGVRRSSSFQRMTIRSMSALGTRAFAAPEVVNKVREKSDGDAALADHVADYGLIADAYSVGCTIKVLLTGVPAEVTDVMGFIGANDNFLLNILSSIFACGKSSKDGSRKKRYKFLDETPKPARELIGKLMQSNVENRLTVPLAKDEPWIKGGLGADDPIVELPQGDFSVGIDDPIVCLKCARRV